MTVSAPIARWTSAFSRSQALSTIFAFWITRCVLAELALVALGAEAGAVAEAQPAVQAAWAAGRCRAPAAGSARPAGVLGAAARHPAQHQPQPQQQAGPSAAPGPPRHGRDAPLGSRSLLFLPPLIHSPVVFLLSVFPGDGGRLLPLPPTVFPLCAANSTSKAQGPQGSSVGLGGLPAESQLAADPTWKYR